MRRRHRRARCYTFLLRCLGVVIAPGYGYYGPRYGYYGSRRFYGRQLTGAGTTITGINKICVEAAVSAGTQVKAIVAASTTRLAPLLF